MIGQDFPIVKIIFLIFYYFEKNFFKIGEPKQQKSTRSKALNEDSKTTSR